MANPGSPGRVRKSVKRGRGKGIVEGGSIRLADEVRISSPERPTTTDASSRLVGWSCSRPKPAMHGCSIARQRINIAQAGNFKYVWLELDAAQTLTNLADRRRFPRSVMASRLTRHRHVADVLAQQHAAKAFRRSFLAAPLFPL